MMPFITSFTATFGGQSTKPQTTTVTPNPQQHELRGCSDARRPALGVRFHDASSLSVRQP
jgi:hypothetical protein